MHMAKKLDYQNKLEWEQPEPHIIRTLCGRFLAQANYAATEWELFRKFSSGEVISLGGYVDKTKAKLAAHHAYMGWYRTGYRSVNIRDGYTEVYLVHENKLFEFHIHPDKVVCHMYNRSDARGMKAGTLEGTLDECKGSLINMADKLLKLVPVKSIPVSYRGEYKKDGRSL